MTYLRGLAVAAVVLAAVPAVATEEPSPETIVRTLAQIGTCNSPSFSPDGKTIAFVSDLSGSPQVWTVPSTSGWPTRITSLEDPVGAVAWSPDGSWLAFSLAPGGGMNAQVYVVRPDGTGVRRLTEGGKVNTFLGDFTDDGKRLWFSSNRRDPSATDPYLMDPSTGTAVAVLETRGFHSITDVSRDGAYAVVNRSISRGSNDLVLVRLSDRSEQVLTPHSGPGTFSGGTFSPDGRTVYLGSNKDRDLVAFARVKLGPDGKAGPIEILAERPDAELQSLAVNHEGTSAALVWNVAGRSELAFVDLRSGRLRPGPKLTTDVIGGLEWSRDGRKLAFVASGAAAPSNIHVLDVAGGKLTRVTDSPHAGVDLGALVRPELVRYKAHDGLELSGWLYRPRGAAGAGPIVLSFHGGPEGQERPALNSTYQALVARGISVFAPNVRGSSGFGKKFVNLDNGALRENAVRDIKATVDAMIAGGIAHPKRIGIMGGSYGGYMVMAGMAEYPDLFAAGANLFGVVNFATFFKHTEPWMAAISTVEYGDPATEAAMLERLSPIHRVDRVRAPTLVLHGANDTNVPVIEAEQVVDNLKKRGVPVEYVLFPDEGHGWRKMPNRIRSAVSIVGWMEKYLTR